MGCTQSSKRYTRYFRLSSKSTLLDPSLKQNQKTKTRGTSRLRTALTKQTPPGLVLDCALFRLNVRGDMRKILKSYLFQSISDATIHHAVGMWCSNEPVCLSLYGHISDWDTSQVTSMKGLFRNKPHFNEDISSWDVSQVIDMSAMFHCASTFNQPLATWDVGEVQSMAFMFSGAYSPNYSLEDWDLDAISDITVMYYGKTSFNQPLNGWDVSNVQDMTCMFYGATCFNQPLDRWTVGNVTQMHSMFYEAPLFEQFQASDHWVIDRDLFGFQLFASPRPCWD